MPLKLFQNKKNNNQFTIKLKVDLITNVSYAYGHDTEFLIEWKRGNHKGQLQHVYMQNDGDIRPTANILIPCLFTKKKLDSSGGGNDFEFSAKSLTINLKRVAEKKKIEKLSTLQIDLSHMVNKENASKERQYSSTMKGVDNNDFRPYIEFTASVHKGYLTPDDFEDSSTFYTTEPPVDEVSHSFSSERRSSVSSVSSDLSDPSNFSHINESGSFKKDSSPETSDINESSEHKISPDHYQNTKNSNSSVDPFDFSFESTSQTQESGRGRTSSASGGNQNRKDLSSSRSSTSSNGESPIFSSEDELEKLSLQSKTTTNSGGAPSSGGSSRKGSGSNGMNIEPSPMLIPSLISPPNTNRDESHSKKKYSFGFKKKSKSPTNSREKSPTKKSKSPNKNKSSPIHNNNNNNNNNTAGDNGGGGNELSEEKERRGSFERLFKRRHSTPNLNGFSVKSFKDKSSRDSPSSPTIPESSGSGQHVEKKKEKTLLMKLSNIGKEDSSDKDSVQSVLISRSLDPKLDFSCQEMILSKRPEYCGNVPVSPLAIYKTLFDWKDFSSNNAVCITKLTESLNFLAKKKAMDKERAFYWLSSSYTMSNLMERYYTNLIGKVGKEKLPDDDLQKNSESQNIRYFLIKLNQYQKNFWHLYWDNLKIDLFKVMEKLIEKISVKNIEEQGPLYLNFLLGTLEFLEKRLPFPSLWPIIFKQVFFYTNGFLFNKFLTDTNVSSTTSAMNTKLFISDLNQWILENKDKNYFYYFKTEMNIILQILDVLMIDKSSLKEENIRRDICPSLSSTQLAILLCRFNPENPEEEVEPSLIKYLQDEGIRKEEIQNITVNLDSLTELPDNPEPNKNIMDIKLPSYIFQ
ncbi:hypothetical protein CYY_007960 [Polysphondylium violaceum]|uniref:Dilute domain-containing protein n=1 Tax=Polysphondylium violaceum TaxID=133409 RepID=A0A8J4PP05_9MYCE|nr:hypothetical protein CYY_007960 [Polysphondylium violaceum]